MSILQVFTLLCLSILRDNGTFIDEHDHNFKSRTVNHDDSSLGKNIIYPLLCSKIYSVELLLDI